jgi:hypothetical protein
LQQWFAAGAPFNLKAEKWDVKCATDAKFFRLTLRPNLAMRFHPETKAQVTADAKAEADMVAQIAGC